MRGLKEGEEELEEKSQFVDEKLELLFQMNQPSLFQKESIL